MWCHVLSLISLGMRCPAEDQTEDQMQENLSKEAALAGGLRSPRVHLIVKSFQKVLTLPGANIQVEK